MVDKWQRKRGRKRFTATKRSLDWHRFKLICCVFLKILRILLTRPVLIKFLPLIKLLTKTTTFRQSKKLSTWVICAMPARPNWNTSRSSKERLRKSHQEMIDHHLSSRFSKKTWQSQSLLKSSKVPPPTQIEPQIEHYNIKDWKHYLRIDRKHNWWWPLYFIFVCLSYCKMNLLILNNLTSND